MSLFIPGDVNWHQSEWWRSKDKNATVQLFKSQCNKSSAYPIISHTRQSYIRFYVPLRVICRLCLHCNKSAVVLIQLDLMSNKLKRRIAAHGMRPCVITSHNFRDWAGLCVCVYVVLVRYLFFRSSQSGPGILYGHPVHTWSTGSPG